MLLNRLIWWIAYVVVIRSRKATSFTVGRRFFRYSWYSMSLTIIICFKIIFFSYFTWRRFWIYLMRWREATSFIIRQIIRRRIFRYSWYSMSLTIIICFKIYFFTYFIWRRFCIDVIRCGKASSFINQRRLLRLTWYSVSLTIIAFKN